MSDNDPAGPGPAATAAGSAAGGSGLADAVLAGLDQAGMRWCLLRGSGDGQAAAGDVDILVAAGDAARAMAIIEAHGLIRLAAHGRGTHAFFLGLDPATNTWIELDLVTEIAFGRHLEVRTAAADECLARRQRRQGAWALAPEDEFWSLLLHCLLDQRAVPGRHARRLAELRRRAAGLGSPVLRALPAAAAVMLVERARSGAWAGPGTRRAVLAAWWRAHPVSATRRSVASAALRLAERPLQAWHRRGISVALLGPDGAGKSTLAAGIESTFHFPVRRVYFGLWPSAAAPRGSAGQAVRVVIRPFSVWRRYLGSIRHRALGRLVVFDRYVYDALLPPRGSLGWLKRPYFHLLSRLCPAPDVVLLLDAPGRVLHARSNEYDPAHLEAERRQYRLLRRRIPHLQRLDADRPAELVLGDAVGRIWHHYLRRGVR